MRAYFFFSAVLLIGVLSGCSLDRRGIGAASDGGPPIDAARDAGDGGGIDGGEIDGGDVDGGEIDGGDVDAGELDAGSDSGIDGGQDGGLDAGQDAGPPPVPGCDRVVLGGRTYLFCTGGDDRDDAQGRCTDAGMALVVISSGGENALLQAEITARGGGGWYIGLGDGDLGDEGDFEWVDGTTPGYTNWDDDQPDNYWGEDCVEILASGRWNDIACWNDRSFICEAP